MTPTSPWRSPTSRSAPHAAASAPFPASSALLHLSVWLRQLVSSELVVVVLAMPGRTPVTLVRRVLEQPLVYTVASSGHKKNLDWTLFFFLLSLEPLRKLL